LRRGVLGIDAQLGLLKVDGVAQAIDCDVLYVFVSAEGGRKVHERYVKMFEARGAKSVQSTRIHTRKHSSTCW